MHSQPTKLSIAIQSAATDDEAACIAAAIEAYLAAGRKDIEVDGSDNAQAPWAVAARLEGAAVSTDVDYGAARSSSQKQAKSLWHGRLLALPALIGIALAATLTTTISIAPAALAEDQVDVEAFSDDSNSSGNQLAYKKPAPPMAPQLVRNRATANNGASSNYASFNTSPNSNSGDNFSGVPSGSIRVCLNGATQKVDLDFPDGGSIYTVAGGNLVARIAPQSSFSLNLAKANGGAQIAFNPKSVRDRINSASNISRVAFVPSGPNPTSMFSPGGLNLAFRSKAAATAEYSQDGAQPAINASLGYIAVPDSTGGDAALVGVAGKLYRGALILKPVNNDSAIAVINVLKLEDYLLSVVPSEVPSLWHKEALKAQAIAARSYAVANLGKHGKEGYDVKATVEDQVYRGIIAEAGETNAAVAETSGLVLKNNNKVISAFFHSTSGGSTEVAENVWGKPLPYLKSVVDYDDASPQFNWKKTVTAAALSKVLAEDTTAAAASQPLLGVLVIGRHPGDSKRVRDVLLVGPGSARLVGGTELRRLFNLPSTQFSLYQSDNSYIFSGRGYGHGLGLSQWGAKALADNGYNAEQILSYYYKDVTIEPLAQDGAI